MQFSNPEILYLLFLLIIPILIHLFQLQRFERVSFTNVKLLKQIKQQTRKSSNLKKILILLSRLLLFTSIILAFANPYSNIKEQFLKSETIIYIDNSLSMQAKGNQGELLEKVKHDLLESIASGEQSYSLITNDNIYRNIEGIHLKETLLKIDYYPIKKEYKNVLLEMNTLFSKNNLTGSNVVLISDFQQVNFDNETVKLDSLKAYTFVQTTPVNTENIAIDSVWIHDKNHETIIIKSNISSGAAKIENLSISLFLDDQLYGKTTVSIEQNDMKEIEFSIPNTDAIKGKISLSDNQLNYDNNFYFSLNPEEKIKVTSIGDEHNFLSKIYTDDEFIFTVVDHFNLDYSQLQNQDLIILNEIPIISKTLIQNLNINLNNYGNLVLIPSEEADIESYNNLLTDLDLGNIQESNDQEGIVTNINYDHPFFRNVFQSKTDNFQYPSVKTSYNSYFNRSSPLLQFNDKSDFIAEINLGNHKFYWIAGSLKATNSNFIASPLVVPVFYNFAKQNKGPKTIYFTIGNKNEITVKTNMDTEDVLHISNGDIDFIPLQSKNENTVRILLENNPELAGIFQIDKSDLNQYLAFNYNREESGLNYKDVQNMIKDIDNATYSTSVKKSLDKIKDEYKKNNLWHLFVIFAFIFLGTEILLQKYL